ncbi:MAG: LCP family protein [Negativicutes bacterium]|jgi:LCP family protein required for cell wall assembly
MKQQPKNKIHPINRKRRLSVTRLVFVVVLFIALFGAMILAVIYSYRHVDNLLHNCERDSNLNAPAINDKYRIIPYRNILVVGLDKTTNKSNADYLAVLSVAPRGGYPAVVLQIPVKAMLLYGNYKYKISLQQLFANGGPLGVANALISHYDIPITDYAVFDYSAVARIVDAAGGIDVFVEGSYDYDDKLTATSIHIKPGFQHFDGKSAVDYARFCKDELGEDGRNKRQTRITRELWGNVFSIKMLLKLFELRQIIENDISTDMPLAQLATTFYALMKSDAKTAVTLTVPGQYSMDKNNNVFAIDESKFRAFVNSTYYEIKPEGKKQ